MIRLPFSALDWATWAGEMAAQAAVLVTALRLPRRDRPHVPLFVFVLIAEVWMRVVQEGVFVPASGQRLVGSLRALYHVETGLVTGWQAAVAALAWWVWRAQRRTAGITGRSSDQATGSPHRMSPEHVHATGDVNPQKTSGPELPEPPPRSLSRGNGVVVAPSFATPNTPLPRGLRAGASYLAWTRANEAGRNLLTLPLSVKAIFAFWLAFNAGMTAAHPLPRGWTQPALHAFAGLCVVLGGLAIMTGWTRRYERAAQVAGYLVVVEGVVAIVGPWAGNVFATWRTVGAAMYGAAFTLLAGWQWWRSTSAAATD